MSPTWNRDNITATYELPFMDLLLQAQTVHRQHFNPNEIELCTLLSIKTGACPEDCGYCSQSGHYKTDIQRERLLPLDEVITQAKAAKASGATRFCMGAAWKNPPKSQMPAVVSMVKAVKELGLESCVTLGMLDQEQAEELSAAGLDYYSHNIDTSPEYYEKIITTRTFQDRLDTLARVQKAGINVCCGGIIGMGETRADRIGFLLALANMEHPPKSVPINRLIPIKGTPLEKTEIIDNMEFVRTVATARIMLPTSMVRLSAGRDTMSEEMHTLCFMAGANSIHYGDTLLTANNPGKDRDLQLLRKLGMQQKIKEEAKCA